MHPTTSTTSSSRSRHSHEKRAPPEASGKTRAVWRNRSSSASDGFASPSAGASSDAAASRDSRTNARVPTSVVNTEVVVCRVDDAVSVVRGAAEEEDSSGTKEPPRASDVPVSSETFRAAPNEDDARGLLADDTGVPPSSSDSAAREAARVSRKMPRGSSVTGWRREGGQRWVVCFPETRVRPEGTRAPRRGSRPRRTSIAHPYVLEGLACEQSRQSGFMSAWLNTHIAPLWTSNPLASNAASRTSAVRARASEVQIGHPVSARSARGTHRAKSARQT